MAGAGALADDGPALGREQERAACRKALGERYRVSSMNLSTLSPDARIRLRKVPLATSL